KTARIRNTHACGIRPGMAEVKHLRIDGRFGKHLVAAVDQMGFGVNKVRAITLNHLTTGRDYGAFTPPAFTAAENSLVMTACELGDDHGKCQLADDCVLLPDEADIRRKQIAKFGARPDSQMLFRKTVLQRRNGFCMDDAVQLRLV